MLALFGKIIQRLRRGGKVPAVANGQLAPPFELTGMDARRYSLKEGLNGGPVLAAFFKVSCPTCQYTLPFLERLFQQLHAAGSERVHIWGISQDNAPDSQHFAREYGVTFPILIDEEPYKISQEYGLSFVPTFFLIAPEGHVQITSDGFSKSDLLAIHQHLARHFSVKLPALFQPNEKVPEFKPG